jgi:hypothetical protein
MAVRYEEGKTPKGAPLLRMYVSGLCTIEEARTLGERILPGKPYAGQRVLVTVAKGTEYTPESRRYFPEMNSHHHAMAVVVTSAIVKAAINLMLRFGSGARNFRMFSDEPAALTWLDEVKS